MKRLYIFYDANCSFCVRCRKWMEHQSAFLELVFLPKNWSELERHFHGLKVECDNELVVVADDGGVYRHDRAYLICLYALEHYRELSFRLAQPAWQPFAGRVFDWLSRNRTCLSRWFCPTESERCLLLRGR